MSSPLTPDYNQQFLLPPCLEDWLPPDHPARFVREFVDQLDLSALGFVMPEGIHGRPPYAPSLLLKIWLYGYLHRIRSTRKLEAACREHVSLLWLSGLMAPDHNSLWRFWNDNRGALREVFKQSVRVAIEVGAVGMVLQALDGTKIQAVASGYKGWSKEYMKKLLAALDQEVDQSEAALKSEEPVEEDQRFALPKGVAEREALREAVKKGLKHVEETGREHYHPKEPSAQRMKCEGKNRFGYNAQAVVDSKAGVVVAVAVSNEENDVGQLVPMVKEAQKLTGAKQAVTASDSGYGAGPDIAAAQAEGLNVLVWPMEGSSSKGQPYHASNFVYDAQTKRVTCPRGERLDFEQNRVKRGVRVDTYRCHCQSCPVRQECSKDRRGRQFTVWPHTEAVQEMRRKVKSPEGKAQLDLRGQIVEKHFAEVKERDGFRRWTFRGVEKVGTQWAMLCCSRNLHVILALWRKTREALSLAIQKVTQGVKTEMKLV